MDAYDLTQNKQPFYIVGIGASAGGLEAIEKFFQNMPIDSGIAFVVVQHLSPDFKSLMNELLARHTEMVIRRAEDGMDVLPNHIYLIPPRKDLTVVDSQLHLDDQRMDGRLQSPINTFLQSLAEDRGAYAISVILSGTGSDGSIGIRAIAEQGGMVLVQDPATAGFDGMPRSAIATGKADLICAPEEMPAKILRHIQHPGYLQLDEEQAGDIITEENEISLIFAILRKKYALDFTKYKSSTILRRIERRMMLMRIQDVAEYVLRLQNDAAEVDKLYRDLLVEVTQFLRDKKAFEILREQIIPDIVKKADPKEGIRVWVPGCATGEEAYSLAMLFHEHLQKLETPVEVKIFATDVHNQSLEIASVGLYDEKSIQGLSPDYLKRYFNHQKGLFKISPELRQMVIFAPQNIIQDPPFTKIDLISCRNVLIYLQPEAQRLVLSRFHFGLKPNGYLFLGASEHLGDLVDEFKTIHSRWRIYSKKRNVRLTDVTAMTGTPLPSAGLAERMIDRMGRPSPVEDWMEGVVAQLAPPGFLVNKQFELMHVFGDGSLYLRQPIGQATLNVLNLLLPDMQTIIRAALQRTIRTGEEVNYRGIMTTMMPGQHLRIDVMPVSGKFQKEYFLISIRPDQVAVGDAPEAMDVGQDVHDSVVTLERELQYTKEYLQTTIEELETTNEELQSTNEELVASNEELQSTNEELHSVNEELYTVNAEHQRKIEELLALNNDMQNLQRSSRVTVIFLNERLEIREFTPAAADIFNLLPQDIGRPIAHLLYNMNITSKRLQELTEQVFETGQVVLQEIFLPTGQHFLMRVLPYRDEKESIRGLVLNFADVTELKQAEAALQESQERFRTIVDNTPIPISITRISDGTILFANRWFADLAKTELDQLLGRPTPLNYTTERRQEVVQGVLISGAPQRFEFAGRWEGQESRFWAESWMHPVEFDHEQALFEAYIDITDRKQAEEAFLLGEKKYRRLFESLPISIWELDFSAVKKSIDGLGLTNPQAIITHLQENPQYVQECAQLTRVVAVNEATRDLLGAEGDGLDREIEKLFATKFIPVFTAEIAALVRDEWPFAREVELETRDGKRANLLLSANLLPGFEQSWSQVLMTAMDVTDVRQAQSAVAQIREEMGYFAHIAGHDLRAPLRALNTYSRLLSEEYGAELAGSGAEYIQFVQENVGKLDQLLQGLLQYSRIEQNDDEEEPVALGSLINELIAIGQLQEKASIEIVPPLPVVNGRRHLLHLMFTHLLDNAVKFSAAGENPEITISAAAQENGWAITIADNGIGIAPQFQERIFRMFQRLHTDEEYPGIGVGLTLVKQIAEKHGGWTAVHSAAGEGSRFVVWLPQSG